jgi:hypothetical protein
MLSNFGSICKKWNFKRNTSSKIEENDHNKWGKLLETVKKVEAFEKSSDIPRVSNKEKERQKSVVRKYVQKVKRMQN